MPSESGPRSIPGGAGGAPAAASGGQGGRGSQRERRLSEEAYSVLDCGDGPGFRSCSLPAPLGSGWGDDATLREQSPLAEEPTLVVGEGDGGDEDAQGGDIALAAVFSWGARSIPSVGRACPATARPPIPAL